MKAPRQIIVVAFLVILGIIGYFAFSGGGGDKASPDQQATGSPASATAAPGASPEKSTPSVPWTTAPAADPAEVAAADAALRKEGARTDATLATFPARAYRRPSQPAGPAAGAPSGEAGIHVPGSGLRVTLQPNQIGEFPEVPAKLSETVGIRLSLPGTRPGTPVRVVILDGGSFPAGEGATRLIEAAAWGGVAFEFTTSRNIGYHRVLVQPQGQAARILNFNARDGESWPPPAN